MISLAFFLLVFLCVLFFFSSSGDGIFQLKLVKPHTELHKLLPKIEALAVSCSSLVPRTSTLSQRQFPQGAPSTTSQRTLRARHETHARAALRFVTLTTPPSAELRFLTDTLLSVLLRGGGEGELLPSELLSEVGAIVCVCVMMMMMMIRLDLTNFVVEKMPALWLVASYARERAKGFRVCF